MAGHGWWVGGVALISFWMGFGVAEPFSTALFFFLPVFFDVFRNLFRTSFFKTLTPFIPKMSFQGSILVPILAPFWHNFPYFLHTFF